ncbi:hypothetical protein PAXRUDRAFT_831781 [Paxillus rubicundulus Ve08.2h10]|uniref:Uncharacterized protein n=1 Tax=Paxillus rubicundulus Ve08.2h10 TaxID=930991 RepID=A0A0D0DV08_9AGAM|nr:hypothetical protein PAXRUDRAFT_831781 [Paxillus rubicundulus Ve08.2h10]
MISDSAHGNELDDTGDPSLQTSRCVSVVDSQIRSNQMSEQIPTMNPNYQVLENKICASLPLMVTTRKVLRF